MADILVIDDEENLALSIQLALRRAGHECRVADTAAAGLAAAQSKRPELILLDIHLPDGNGLEVMAKMKNSELDAPVIVITSFGTVASAVQAMQNGAIDYLQKPIAMDELVLAVDRCLENRRIRDQLDAYQQAQQRESDERPVIAQCTAMAEVLTLARRIAALPLDGEGELSAVLLTGETGTGKEALARFIHRQSSGATHPFVHVNCTAIPENLVESELFGHEAGAFTHAQKTKKGLFEIAHEGTLFLDEIGDMPIGAQAKLLVAIESGRFRRLGATTERACRLRIMAATNSNLEAKVAAGDFRADLYYRLSVFRIELPPLRERGDDLPLLAQHFLERHCRKMHRKTLALSPAAQATMRAYQWPGNVRELANVLQRAALVTDGDTLEPLALGLEPAADRGEVSSTSKSFDFSRDDCTLEGVERRLLRDALEHARGNVSEAARLLGLTRGGLRHRLEKLGLDPQ